MVDCRGQLQSDYSFVPEANDKKKSLQTPNFRRIVIIPNSDAAAYSRTDQRCAAAGPDVSSPQRCTSSGAKLRTDPSDNNCNYATPSADSTSIPLKKDEQRDSPSFKDIPVACNGFALGLVGATNVWLNALSLLQSKGNVFQDISFLWIILIIANASLALAYINMFLYGIKFFFFPATYRKDTSSAALISGQVCHVYIPLLASTTHAMLNKTLGISTGLPGLDLARSFVCFGAVLQIVVMCAFLKRAWREQLFPQPSWFPPTVSLGTFALAGASLQFPVGLIATSMWACFIFMLLTLPPAIIYTLRNPQTVASSGAIGILQAPASFVCITWFNVMRFNGNDVALSGIQNAAFGHFLFIAAMCGVLATLYGTFQRRHHFWGLGLFHPSYAGFTFPSASSANALMLYARWLGNPMEVAIPALLCAITVVLAIAVFNTLWIRHLFRLLVLGHNDCIINQHDPKPQQFPPNSLLSN